MITQVDLNPGKLYQALGFIVTNLTSPLEQIVGFYHQRGTVEQWNKEGKGEIKWELLSYRTITVDYVYFALNAPAYNLGNFPRTLVTSELITDWLLTCLREELIKISAKAISLGCYAVFQIAAVATVLIASLRDH